MMLHHVYSLLTAMGCLWLCSMLHHGWPRRPTVPHHKPTEPVPLQCKRKQSNAPKPFEGLTQRLCRVCTRCDPSQAAASTATRADAAAPPTPPGA